MKILIKKFLFWVVLVEIITITILYFSGFIVFHPSFLDNNWDAISVCASWTGVFVSIITVFVAIQIPKKIAKSQNDIALFEKRWDLRSIVLELKDFGKTLSEIKNSTIEGLSVITRYRHYLIVFMFSGDRDEEIQRIIGLNMKMIYDEHEQFIGYQVDGSDDKELDEYEKNFKNYIGRQKRIIKQYSLLLDRDSEDILIRLADVYSKLMIQILLSSDLKNNKISSFKSNQKFEKYFFDADSTEVVKNEFLRLIKELDEGRVLEKIEEYLRVKE